VKRFLLQMHGESGAGKSTLALAVGETTGAVVINKDHITGPLIEEGVLQLGAGPGFAVFYTLAESLLSQGFSVVLDSGCFWQAILDRGHSLASQFDVDYRLVECCCPDSAEQEARLKTRSRFVGQPASRTELNASLSRPGVLLEIAEPHLVVDTTQPLQACVDQVLGYLEG